MKEVCLEHGNSAEIMCLDDQCRSRLMCYLCQHNHQLFSSLRNATQVNRALFQKKVDAEIDKSMVILADMEASGGAHLKSEIEKFYDDIQADLSAMLETRKKDNVRILSSTNNSDIGTLIKARISGKYHQLAQDPFAKVKQVWDGVNLVVLAREERKAALESAYNQMKIFHEECSQLFSKFQYKLHCRVPEIRLASKTPQAPIFESYDEELPSSKLTQTLLASTKEDAFSSLISDCLSNNSTIITVSYDKMFRVFDKKLNILAEHEFVNILTRIEPIATDIYAVGVSKQLHIIKASEEKEFKVDPILTLRGHKERILDLHSLNSRIVGSCSDEGAKIWDLYKQKCEYNIKQQMNPSCLRFMPALKNIAVGYHSHEVKIYTLEKIRPIRCYNLQETPLCLSQQNRNENLIYSAGFRSSLSLFDIRLSKEVMTHNFKSQAITCLKESVFEPQCILLGERGGKARIFDLRKMKGRLEWMAHSGKSNLSRPNGVVRIFEESSGQILTAGCNDQRLALWGISGE